MEIAKFLNQVASDTPTPGGGSASALVGALSASPCAMVSGLSMKRGKLKKYEAKKIRNQCHLIQKRLYKTIEDAQLTRPPLIDPACFIQQLFQADDHFASQYTPTIFRYPHQVVLQTVSHMGPSLIFSYSQIMPEFTPLHQVSPGILIKLHEKVNFDKEKAFRFSHSRL